MKHYSIAVLFLLITACCSCSNTPQTLIKGGYDEAEMDAAIARARNEIEGFIKDLSSGNGESFFIKVAIEDENGTEHFWLSDVVYKKGQFNGVINNEPGIVENVKLGQSWKVKKKEITDWMFMRDDKMFGNYTMRPLLGTMPKEEAAKYKAMFANP